MPKDHLFKLLLS